MNAAIRAGSVASAQSPHIEGRLSMLARRFTIVCLLVALFGIYFAILVAEASRHARSWGGCAFDDKPACPTPIRK